MAYCQVGLPLFLCAHVRILRRTVMERHGMYEETKKQYPAASNGIRGPKKKNEYNKHNKPPHPRKRGGRSQQRTENAVKEIFDVLDFIVSKKM